MSILLSILTQGLIYSLMALGVYITYSILDFPDLSVDSTFPFGAAVTAAAIVAGVPAPLTLPLSFAAGALAGTATGLIHVKLKIRDLTWRSTPTLQSRSTRPSDAASVPSSTPP